MSLRDIARNRPSGKKPWMKKLSEDEYSQLEDLWDGVKDGEYSQSAAYRVWAEVMTAKPISRSAFVTACLMEFNGNEPTS